MAPRAVARCDCGRCVMADAVPVSVRDDRCVARRPDVLALATALFGATRDGRDLGGPGLSLPCPAVWLPSRSALRPLQPSRAISVAHPGRGLGGVPWTEPLMRVQNAVRNGENEWFPHFSGSWEKFDGTQTGIGSSGSKRIVEAGGQDRVPAG